MAATNRTPNNSQKPSNKKSLSKRIVAFAIVLLCGILGFLAYRLKERRVLAKSPSRSAGQADATNVSAPPVDVISLSPFVVNLADPGHNTFLRIGVALGLDKALPAGSSSDTQASYTPIIRDSVLTVVTQWQSANLLAPNGKAGLKAQLLKTLQKRLPKLGIVQIYLTNFLIQE